MNMRQLLLVVLPLCFASLMGAPKAQSRTQYESEWEQAGAAAFWTYGMEMTLQYAVDYCMTLGSTTAAAATAALWRWKERHETYLFVSAYYRMEFRKFIAANPDTPEIEQLKKMTTQDTDEIIKANAEALILMFRKAEEAVPKEGGAHMCGNYFRSVEDGKMDLKNRNPGLAAFMDQDPVGQYYVKQYKKGE